MSEALSFDTDFTAEQVKEAESDFHTLANGDYVFQVIKAEKGTYQPKPNSKITEVCPMMTITIQAESEGGERNRFNERLILFSSTKGIIFQFFECVGLRKKGETGKLPWDKIVGASGIARITQREYTGNDGTKKTVNQVARWLGPKIDEDY